MQSMFCNQTSKCPMIESLRTSASYPWKDDVRRRFKLEGCCPPWTPNTSESWSFVFGATKFYLQQEAS